MNDSPPSKPSLASRKNLALLVRAYEVAVSASDQLKPPQPDAWGVDEVQIIPDCDEELDSFRTSEETQAESSKDHLKVLTRDNNDSMIPFVETGTEQENQGGVINPVSPSRVSTHVLQNLNEETNSPRREASSSNRHQSSFLCKDEAKVKFSSVISKLRVDTGVRAPTPNLEATYSDGASDGSMSRQTESNINLEKKWSKLMDEWHIENLPSEVVIDPPSSPENCKVKPPKRLAIPKAFSSNFVPNSGPVFHKHYASTSSLKSKSSTSCRGEILREWTSSTAVPTNGGGARETGALASTAPKSVHLSRMASVLTETDDCTVYHSALPSSGNSIWHLGSKPLNPKKKTRPTPERVVESTIGTQAKAVSYTCVLHPKRSVKLEVGAKPGGRRVSIPAAFARQGNVSPERIPSAIIVEEHKTDTTVAPATQQSTHQANLSKRKSKPVEDTSVNKESSSRAKPICTRPVRVSIPSAFSNRSVDTKYGAATAKLQANQSTNRNIRANVKSDDLNDFWAERVSENADLRSEPSVDSESGVATTCERKSQQGSKPYTFSPITKSSKLLIRKGDSLESLDESPNAKGTVTAVECPRESWADINLVATTTKPRRVSIPTAFLGECSREKVSGIHGEVAPGPPSRLIEREQTKKSRPQSAAQTKVAIPAVFESTSISQAPQKPATVNPRISSCFLEEFRHDNDLLSSVKRTLPKLSVKKDAIPFVFGEGDEEKHAAIDASRSNGVSGKRKVAIPPIFQTTD